MAKVRANSEMAKKMSHSMYWDDSLYK